MARLTEEQVKERCEIVGCSMLTPGGECRRKEAPASMVTHCPIGRAVPPVEPAPVEDKPVPVVGHKWRGFDDNVRKIVAVFDDGMFAAENLMTGTTYRFSSLDGWTRVDDEPIPAPVEPAVEEAKREKWPLGTVMESAWGVWWQKGEDRWMLIDRFVGEWAPGDSWPGSLLEGDMILWTPPIPAPVEPAVEVTLTTCPLGEAWMERINGLGLAKADLSNIANLRDQVRVCKERASEHWDWHGLMEQGIRERDEELLKKIAALTARVDGIAPSTPEEPPVVEAGQWWVNSLNGIGYYFVAIEGQRIFVRFWTKKLNPIEHNDTQLEDLARWTRYTPDPVGLDADGLPYWEQDVYSVDEDRLAQYQYTVAKKHHAERNGGGWINPEEQRSHLLRRGPNAPPNAPAPVTLPPVSDEPPPAPVRVYSDNTPVGKGDLALCVRSCPESGVWECLDPVTREWRCVTQGDNKYPPGRILKGVWHEHGMKRIWTPPLDPTADAGTKGGA